MSFCIFGVSISSRTAFCISIDGSLPEELPPDDDESPDEPPPEDDASPEELPPDFDTSPADVESPDLVLLPEDDESPDLLELPEDDESPELLESAMVPDVPDDFALLSLLCESDDGFDELS